MAILYSKKKYARFENIFYFLNILPFGIYALINILLWIFEFSFESTNELVIGKALLLEKFGIFVNRIKFPLANGINSYGTVVGGLLTISLVYLFVVKKNKLSTMGIITVLITTVLLTDSRGALIYSFLILGAIWYYRSSKSFPAVFKIVPLMPILGSFLLISVTQILSTTGLGAFLSRSSGDLESGNGRFLIWGYSLTEFIQFKIIQVIGYGDNGHVGSGVSNLWQNMFLTYGETTNMHPHNTTLAILFDIGYIGLAVYIYFLWRVLTIIQKFWNINRNFSLVMLSFLLYTVLIGITESLYGFYYQNSIYFFFSIFAIAFVAETIYDRQQVKKGKSRDLIKANWPN
ncbi:O-antigen ligase [Dyadobacter sp. CY351]|uniref:O-antigen ligase family protein n=1 Tax=Dyadobacter sp. CY351 TaxID=2909337 RepID=UPI001F357D85|nr:O-antigen ligase family protein [Dyadobacter sp. CY351]MCF2518424.1 O-antigen ligase family protein [Dyadobacter sp. CY351]